MGLKEPPLMLKLPPIPTFGGGKLPPLKTLFVLVLPLLIIVGKLHFCRSTLLAMLNKLFYTVLSQLLEQL